jgi:hypothetical protein
MRINIDKRKNLEEASLEEIIGECSSLLNQGNLPHRTIRYFGWFVSESIDGELKTIYGGNINYGEGSLEENIRNWGLLFYEYCLKEYHVDNQ